MANYTKIRLILENILSDNNWHNTEEFLQICASHGLHLDDRSSIYNIMHNLKKKGIIQADGHGNHRNITNPNLKSSSSELLSSIS